MFWEGMEQVAKTQQEINRRQNKVSIYANARAWALKIGIVMLGILLFTNSVFPCIKEEEEEIKFAQYSQSLELESYCYVDVVNAIYIGSLIESGIDEIQTEYFYVLDAEGNAGIISFQEEDIEISEDQINSVRYYGTIVEAPGNITPQIDIMLENGIEDAMQESQEFQELLSSYKIMECKLDMPMTKMVDKPGVGLIFLGLFLVCMLIRIVLKSMIQTENSIIQSLMEKLFLLQNLKEECENGNLSNKEMS